MIDAVIAVTVFAISQYRVHFAAPTMTSGVAVCCDKVPYCYRCGAGHDESRQLPKTSTLSLNGGREGARRHLAGDRFGIVKCQ